MEWYRYFLLYEDGTVEAHDIMGLPEEALELFDQVFMEVCRGYHQGDHLSKPIQRIELVKAHDVDVVVADFQIPRPAQSD